MLIISHPEIFEATVEEARSSAGGDARWMAAIDRAVREMTDHPERFHWMGAHMLIHSPTSDEVYESDGDCQCIAYAEFHRACKHRAASRLWLKYLSEVDRREWLWAICGPNFPGAGHRSGGILFQHL